MLIVKKLTRGIFIAAIAAVTLATLNFWPLPSRAAACSPSVTSYESDGSIYTVLTFAQSQSGCEWTPSNGLTSVDALLVAGGGGGGSRIGGGGGGGEVKVIENQTVSENSNYTVVVGAGGSGGTIDPSTANGSVGSNGTNSSIFGVTVAGGGGGGFLGGPSQIGQNGGSGGGGSCLSAITAGTSSKLASGLGYSGGSGANAGGSGCVAGGGGGAGGAGSSGLNQSGGSGGAGASITFASTSAIVYAGGGGGGLNAGDGAVSTGNPGLGGSGGGGNAGPKNTINGPVDGLSGTDGLGGGGGGGSNHYGTFSASTSATGGDGGDGIVIIRYIAPPRFLKVGNDEALNQNPVLLVDPRSNSVPIPFLRLNASTNSRICVDLFTDSGKSSNIELKNSSAASSFHRLSVSNSASGITAAENTTVNSSSGMKLTGSRTDVAGMLNPAVSANESYLRLFKPDSGWVEGSVLRIRADYATDSDCSGVSDSEVAVDMQIKIVGIQVTQQNEVSVS